MNVNGVSNSSSVQKLVSQPVYREVSPDGAGGVSRAADKLELSGNTHLLKTLQKNDIRVDKVAQIKAQIEAGTYETDAKVDGAIDKMMGDLA